MTEAEVLEALRKVVDPELGINIVDLGLVYSVGVDDKRAHVNMTMTTQTCPLHAYLAEAVESVLRQSFPDLEAVGVEMVWDPPWNPAMMSEAAKRQLGWKE